MSDTLNGQAKPTKPKTWRRRWVGRLAKGVLVLVLLVVGYVGWLYYDAQEELIVSEETTHITGPLRADGTVDYVAYYNEKLSKGVTPENNGAIPFLKMFLAGNPTTVTGEEETWKTNLPQIAALLGVKEESLSGGVAFQNLHDFYRAHPELFHFNKDEAVDRDPHVPCDEQHDAMERCWDRKAYPGMYAWLEANRTPLATLATIARKEKFYLPLVATESERPLQSGLLGSWSFVDVWELARATACHATEALGRGEVAVALDDAETLFRMGGHLAGDPLSMHNILVGYRVIYVGHTLVATLLGQDLTEEQLARLASIVHLPIEFQSGYVQAMLVEAHAILDLTQVVFARDVELIGEFEIFSPFRPFINVNRVLRICNRVFITYAKKVPQATTPEEIGDIVKEIVLENEYRNRGGVIRSVLRNGPDGFVAEMISTMLLPAFDRTGCLMLNRLASQRAVQVAVAVEQYRRAKGRYPVKLEDLLVDPVTKYPLNLVDPMSNEKALLGWRLLETEAGPIGLLFSRGMDTITEMDSQPLAAIRHFDECEKECDPANLDDEDDADDFLIVLPSREQLRKAVPAATCEEIKAILSPVAE